jgi:hypothetical protein
MKLPKKVNVMGSEFNVKLVKNNKWVGKVSIFTKTLYINSEVPIGIQIEALLHEIMEYIFYRLGFTEETKKWRCILMRHCKDNKPDDIDTFNIFMNVLADTLVRNGFVR